MKAFKVTGSFPMGRLHQTFSIEVAAEDEAGAREKVLSDIGSKHFVKRRFVEIASITPIDSADIENHVVKYLVGGPK